MTTPDPKCMLCAGTGWTSHVVYFDGRPRIETPCARCDPDETGRIFRQGDPGWKFPPQTIRIRL